MPPLVGSVENQSLAKRMRPGLGIPILKICVHFGAQVLPTESVCAYYFISYQTIIWIIIVCNIYIYMYLHIRNILGALQVSCTCQQPAPHPKGHHGVKWAKPPVFRTRCWAMISVAAGKVLEWSMGICTVPYIRDLKISGEIPWNLGQTCMVGTSNFGSWNSHWSDDEFMPIIKVGSMKWW